MQQMNDADGKIQRSVRLSFILDLLGHQPITLRAFFEKDFELKRFDNVRGLGPWLMSLIDSNVVLALVHDMNLLP